MADWHVRPGPGLPSVQGQRNLSVHVKGIVNATVKVCISNDPTQPLNTVHELEAGETKNKDAVFKLDFPVAWVKARVSAYTSGTISAYLEGV